MPTIKDVAKRAGVSPVTVSRVVNDARNVNAATQDKVERAIEELGYVPSVMARSLRSKRTRTLALIVSDITNPFWTTVARGVEDTAQSRDHSVFLYNTDENSSRQRRCLDAVIAQRMDGVIIAPHDSDAQHLAKLRQRNVPTVIIDRRIESWDVDRDEIEETVRKYCAELAPGGGYVLSSSNGIEEGILPENFVAMTQAVHKYGRYGALGGDA